MSELGQIFSFSAYVLNPYSIAPFLVATLVLIFGIFLNYLDQKSLLNRSLFYFDRRSRYCKKKFRIPKFFNPTRGKRRRLGIFDFLKRYFGFCEIVYFSDGPLLRQSRRSFSEIF